jgi:hypothetical protein
LARREVEMASFCVRNAAPVNLLLGLGLLGGGTTGVAGERQLFEESVGLPPEGEGGY